MRSGGKGGRTAGQGKEMVYGRNKDRLATDNYERADFRKNHRDVTGGRFQGPALQQGDDAVVIRMARALVQQLVEQLEVGHRQGKQEKRQQQRGNHPPAAASGTRHFSQYAFQGSHNSAQTPTTGNGNLCKQLAKMAGSQPAPPERGVYTAS